MASVLEKFEERVFPDPNSGCWLWGGSYSKKSGYGYFTNGRSDRGVAHRFAWRLYNNEDPGELLVCHECDNTACVNPRHLFLGTHGDNLADASRKGRLKHKPGRPNNLPTGERHHSARLTEGDVREIRQSEMPLKPLSQKYGVSLVMISKIKRSKAWKEVS